MYLINIFGEYLIKHGRMQGGGGGGGGGEGGAMCASANPHTKIRLI